MVLEWPDAAAVTETVAAVVDMDQIVAAVLQLAVVAEQLAWVVLDSLVTWQQLELHRDYLLQEELRIVGVMKTEGSELEVDDEEMLAKAVEGIRA